MSQGQPAVATVAAVAAPAAVPLVQIVVPSNGSPSMEFSDLSNKWQPIINLMYKKEWLAVIEHLERMGSLLDPNEEVCRNTLMALCYMQTQDARADTYFGTCLDGNCTCSNHFLSINSFLYHV
jgi:hypothetical protein